MTSNISYYAELLLNIRTLTVAISLPSLSSSLTCLELTEDCKAIHLIHHCEERIIKLPAKVLPVKLPIPDVPSSTLNVRLHINASEPLMALAADQGDNTYPWTASSLHSSDALTCRICANVFVAAYTIHQWKDLPSENWAEMMDFWHCHKPEVPAKMCADDAADLKGYSASSHLSARSNTGFVDVCQFLFSQGDCSGLEVFICSFL